MKGVVLMRSKCRSRATSSAAGLEISRWRWGITLAESRVDLIGGRLYVKEGWSSTASTGGRASEFGLAGRCRGGHGVQPARLYPAGVGRDPTQSSAAQAVRAKAEANRPYFVTQCCVSIEDGFQ